MVSRGESVESLEPRRLLAAAASSVDLLAQFNGPTGLQTISHYIAAHPTAALSSYIDLDGSRQLFNSQSASTLQLKLKAGANVEGAIKLVKAVDGARWAAANTIYDAVKSELTPNDPRYPRQTGQLDVIGAPKAWDHSLGQGVIVAVLDDGVDIDHEDLAANIWKNSGEISGNNIDDDNNGFVDDVNGWDFGSNDNNVKPEFDQRYNFINSHGTAVAGVIGASINNGIGIAGIAPQVKIMPVRFNGYGVTVTSAGIAQSLAYAVNNGAKIINISFSIDPYMNDPAFAAAVDLVNEKGVLWINSAGNSAVENPPRFKIEQALFVANTSNNDTLYVDSNYGVGIDIAAPGVDLLTTAPGNVYQLATGTSFSTAVTSGAAALIWAKYPTWSREQVTAQLIGTADNIDAKNPTFIGKLGGGRVNAGRAVTETIAAPRVRGLTSAALLTSTPTSLTLNLNSILAPAAVNAGAFELRFAGQDGMFDANDTIIPLSLSNTYNIGTNQLKFTHPALAEGHYQFVAKDTLVNPFGVALDGDGDGIAGGRFVSAFSVITVLPAAPTEFTVRPATSSGDGITLSWKDNASNESGYLIERSRSADFAVIDKTLTAPANQTTSSDANLLPDATYYYRVRAISLGGNSAAVTLRYDVPPVVVAPSAPAGLSAANTTAGVLLKWTNTSTSVTKIIIERSVSAAFTNAVKFEVAGNPTQYVDKAPAGTTFYYRIRAANTAGESANSGTASIKTAGSFTGSLPKAPNALKVRNTATGVALEWSDKSSNETAFELERSVTLNFALVTVVAVGANVEALMQIGLPGNTTFYYRVRALNAQGVSSYSNTATIKTAASVTPLAGSSLIGSSWMSGSTLFWQSNTENEIRYIL
jgi:subtilisin family serine protease